MSYNFEDPEFNDNSANNELYDLDFDESLYEEDDNYPEMMDEDYDLPPYSYEDFEDYGYGDNSW